jgi:hypothetical protein
MRYGWHFGEEAGHRRDAGRLPCCAGVLFRGKVFLIPMRCGFLGERGQARSQPLL